MAIETVVDSSVIVALVTPEEHSDWASKKISGHNYFHILDLNYYEVSNAIKSKTSGKFEGKDAMKAFTEAVKLMNLYAIHSFSEIIADAIALSLKLDVTVYDAAFLSLAEKLGIQLLTLDTRLRNRIKDTKYYRIIECPDK